MDPVTTAVLVVAGLLLLGKKKAPGPAKPLTVADSLQAKRLTGFAVSTPRMQKLNIPSLESIRYGSAAGKAATGGISGGTGSPGGGRGRGTFTP